MVWYYYASNKNIVYPSEWCDQSGLEDFLEEAINSNRDGAYVGWRGVGVKIRKFNRNGSQFIWFQRALADGEHEYERVDPDTYIPAELYWMNPEGLHGVIEKAKESGENGDIIKFGGFIMKLKTDQHASPFIRHRDLIFEPQIKSK